MEARFISAPEVVELLGISRSSVDRLTKSGKMPSYLVGDRRLFDKEEIIAWVKSHPSTQAPTKKAVPAPKRSIKNKGCRKND